MRKSRSPSVSAAEPTAQSQEEVDKESVLLDRYTPQGSKDSSKAGQEGWDRVRTRVKPKVGVDLKPSKDIWVTVGGRAKRTSQLKPPAKHSLNWIFPEIKDETVEGSTKFLTTAFDNLLISVAENDPKHDEIHLRGNRITNEGCKLISEALSKNTVVECLDLSDNVMDDSGAAAVAVALQNNKSLKKLTMTGNTLEDAFCAGLQPMILHSNLQELELNRGIACSGIALFAPSLAINQVLKKINLSSNLIKDDGGCILAMALRGNTTLKTLDLAKNQMTDDCVERERVGPDGQVIHEGWKYFILANNALVNMDFTQNRFADPGGGVLANALEKNRDCAIERLNVSGCNITTPIGGKVKSAIATRISRRQDLLDELEVKHYFRWATCFQGA